MKTMRRRRWVDRFTALAAGLMLLALASTAALAPAGPALAQSPATAPVAVLLDGRPLALDPAPVIIDGRVLVPLRGVFEQLGASVHWDGATRTIVTQRPGHYVRLQIGRRLACLAAGCQQAAVLDVPAVIRNDRTFVPLRFVAQAMGTAVSWDGVRRQVLIADGGAPDASPVRIATVAPGQRITGPVTLQAQLAGVQAATIRYFLLNRETGRGPIVALGANAAGGYPWRPDPAHDGPRLLAAVAYAADGRIVGSDVIPVTVEVSRAVTLEGVAPGQSIRPPVTLRVRHGFASSYVRYALVDPATGQAATIAEVDPDTAFTWWPQLGHAGQRVLRATVFDRAGRGYASQDVPVSIEVTRTTAMGGVRAGQSISGPVTLRVTVNYLVSRVQFVLDGGTVIADGVETSARWFPGPGVNGGRTVSARVWDQSGNAFTTEAVPVQVAAQPAVRLQGVGPNQVVSGAVDLRVETNVALAGVEFQLINPSTGAVAAAVARGADPGASYRWTPSAGQDGAWRIRAVGTDPQGGTVPSEQVAIRIFTGRIHAPVAIAPREEFVALVSRFALADYQRTGMSAALQVAQAILETGWGQSVPVDQYTGLRSNNLFGIKGTGPAGSVISNTWEEYNGVAYRVDDRFRAYHDVGQSWQDHKTLLLGGARYAPYRAVMHDPVLGAWALRRSGYATDSRYAIKLIDIMQRNNLFALDDTEP